VWRERKRECNEGTDNKDKGMKEGKSKRERDRKWEGEVRKYREDGYEKRNKCYEQKEE